MMGAEDWIEVSLIVDGEMAEAVSEVLARFVSGGVVIESTQISKDLEGEGQVVGPLRVYGYIEVEESGETKRQDLEEALWHLGMIRPLPEAQYRPVSELDWSQIWKKHFHPIPIGRQLIIIPTWLDVANETRTAVRIDPGLAFGTGTHPSTQICLQFLDEYLGDLKAADQNWPENQLAMIDVGCGSGILGIAAAKLGINYVLGVDQDHKAIEVARKNAVDNGVQEKMELCTGSVSEVVAGQFSIKSAPLVVANILSPILIHLLDAGLSELVVPGGKLILSGILEQQVTEVETAIKGCGLSVQEERRMEDWRALIATKGALG
jgi:ribosomal protein L11 methyltransferase